MNLKKIIYKKKWIKWGVIPLFLFTLGSSLALLYIILLDESFLVFTHSHSRENFSSLTFSRLQKGSTVSGFFTAKANNLGILGVRLQTYSRVPYRQEDKLLFRIREKGSREWYYENIYRSGLIYDFSIFPFGFPIIQDSKGRKYEFEIKSLEGNSENSISINKREPIFVSKYQETRENLTQSPLRIPFFVLKKVENYLNNIDVQFSAFIYLLPMVFYLISISSLAVRVIKKISNIYPPMKILLVKSNYYLFSAILGAAILFDIIYLQVQNSMLYIVIGIMIYVIGYSYKISSKNPLAVGLVLLLLSVFLYYFSYFQIAERSASWSYIFLVVAAMQMISEKND